MQNAYVARATLSLAARVLFAIYLSAPSLPAAQLSPDARLHPQVFAKVQALCLEQASRTSGALSKSMPLLIRELQNSCGEQVWLPAFILSVEALMAT
jgi:hypothetical protein